LAGVNMGAAYTMILYMTKLFITWRISSDGSSFINVKCECENHAGAVLEDGGCPYGCKKRLSVLSIFGLQGPVKVCCMDKLLFSWRSTPKQFQPKPNLEGNRLAGFDLH